MYKLKNYRHSSALLCGAKVFCIIGTSRRVIVIAKTKFILLFNQLQGE